MNEKECALPAAQAEDRAKERARERFERRKHNKFRYRYSLTAYLMLLPAFVLLTIFVIVPLVMAIVRSFQDYTTGEFVGFYNYKYILTTANFVQSFTNVLLFAAIVTVVMVVGSFLFASALKSLANRLSSVARVVIFVPFFLSAIIAGVIFSLLTNYGGGLISSILISLDMEPIAFTTQGIWPQVLVIYVTVWLGFGYNSLVMYAGIINIPREYYEAAKIDGANAWRSMLHITVPNMRNYFVLIIINLVTTNLQMMEVPYMLTEGGPLNGTLTPVLYLFNSFRDPSRPENVTTAGALLIMLLIMAVNIVVFKLIRSEKSADV